MKVSAFDLLGFIPEVQRIAASTELEKQQKADILRELLHAIPEPVFCSSAPVTRQYVTELIKGSINGGTEKAPVEIPTQEGNGTDAAAGTEEKLLHETGGNPGRTGVAKRVVKKTTQKRRTTKGGA